MFFFSFFASVHISESVLHTRVRRQKTFMAHLIRIARRPVVFKPVLWLLTVRSFASSVVHMFSPSFKKKKSVNKLSGLITFNRSLIMTR